MFEFKPGVNVINVSDSEIFYGQFVEWQPVNGQSLPVVRKHDGTEVITMGMLFPYDEKTWSLLLSLGKKKAYEWARDIYICCMQRNAWFANRTCRLVP